MMNGASMKISTKRFIFRVTAAAISLALTGAVFGIAVAHSKIASIVAEATASGGYEICSTPNGPRTSPAIWPLSVGGSGDQL
jgi:hypothetical protein